MSNAPRLSGGSESETVGQHSSGLSSMTHAGVEIFFAKKDKHMQVRLLPARDTSYSPADAAFATSVLPYRRDDGIGVDTETQTELFTAWYVMVRGYRYFGRSSSDFLSPLTMSRIPGIDPMSARDPLNDIRQFCYNHSDPAIKALTDKGSGGDKMSAVVPSSSVYILANALINDGEKWHPGAEIYASTSAAFDDLKEALAVRRHDGCTNIPLDPVWGKYMLGDVTSIAHGAIANVVKRSVGTVSPWCFDYTTNKQNSVGYQPHPMDPSSEAVQNILRGRKDLLDTEKVLKFMSYQEIVNLLAADGSIPSWLIEQACGGSCNLPKFASQNTTYSTPPAGGAPGGAPASPPSTPPGYASPPGGAQASPPGYSAPPGGGAPGGVPGGVAPGAVPGGASAGPPAGIAQSTAAPGLPPTTVQPPAATVPATVWVSQAGNVTEQSGEAVQVLILANPTLKVMSKDQSSGWVTGDKLGFILTPPQQAQTPPPPPPPAEVPTAPDPEEMGSIIDTAPDPEEAAPAAPTTPAATADPTTPASPAAPPSGNNGAEPITAEELAFVHEIKHLIQTKPEDVDGERLTRFTHLNARAVKAGQIQTG